MPYELVRHKDEEPRSIRINIPTSSKVKKAARSNRHSTAIENYVEFIPNEARIRAALKGLAVALPITGLVLMYVLSNSRSNSSQLDPSAFKTSYKSFIDPPTPPTTRRWHQTANHHWYLY